MPRRRAIALLSSSSVYVSSVAVFPFIFHKVQFASCIADEMRNRHLFTFCGEVPVGTLPPPLLGVPLCPTIASCGHHHPELRVSSLPLLFFSPRLSNFTSRPHCWMPFIPILVLMLPTSCSHSCLGCCSASNKRDEQTGVGDEQPPFHHFRINRICSAPQHHQGHTRHRETLLQ